MNSGRRDNTAGEFLYKMTRSVTEQSEEKVQQMHRFPLGVKAPPVVRTMWLHFKHQEQVHFRSMKPDLYSSDFNFFFIETQATSTPGHFQCFAHNANKSLWARFQRRQLVSVQLLQLGLQGLEVPDGLLKRRVGAQRLKLHQVTADVVQTHVSEATSVIGGDSAGVFHVS